MLEHLENLVSWQAEYKSLLNLLTLYQASTHPKNQSLQIQSYAGNVESRATLPEDVLPAIGQETSSRQF